MKTLFISPDGTIRAVACNDLASIAAEIGTVETRRASHVLPAHPVKRAMFRMIRLAVGERGRVAEWCRGWSGAWQVRFADSPRVVRFTHASRAECIHWEVEQLEAQFENMK